LLPITAMSSFLPLNWNGDVRAATRRPRIFTSTFNSSSARPSEKYSSSSSLLRLTNGSTAIDAGSRSRAAAATQEHRFRGTDRLWRSQLALCQEAGPSSPATLIAAD